MYSSTGMPYSYDGQQARPQQTPYYGSPPESPMARMREHYWTAKQAIRTVIGKKEDEHLVASDTELDAKLATYYSLKSTCENMLRCIEHYQDFICDLSEEESTLGRFLKHHGKQNKTQAGKMMLAVGRAESYAAQQRLALRVPLVRLYQELETFTERAVTDCHMTVLKCEKARVEYRGSLLWMKKVSSEFDPDSHRQMEKYRKVQAAVKRNKAMFDRRKLDCLQKVDLLAASRCNLFSNLMANYQNCLLKFWDRTSKAHTTVSNSFTGYQHYEFTVLKQLSEPSRQLAQLTSGKKSDDAKADDDENESKAEPSNSDDSSLINLAADENGAEEKPEADGKSADGQPKEVDSEMHQLLFLEENSPEHKAGDADLLSGGLSAPPCKASAAAAAGHVPKLAPPPDWKPANATAGEFSSLDAVSSLLDSLGQETANKKPSNPGAGGGAADGGATASGDLAQQLFDQVLNTEPQQLDQSSFTYQWQSAFGEASAGPKSTAAGASAASSATPAAAASGGSPLRSAKTFMPSQLLDMAAGKGPAPAASATADSQKAAWFSMFADLDPLKGADPLSNKGDRA